MQLRHYNNDHSAVIPYGDHIQFLQLCLVRDSMVLSSAVLVNLNQLYICHLQFSVQSSLGGEGLQYV